MMRWGWGAAGLVLLMGWGLALWGQAPRLEVTRHSVAGRPLEAAPIRVLQLSDLHLRPEPDWNAAVSKAVRDIDADLIVLTGDMIDRPEALPELIAFLAGLGQVPKFAVLGNWEHWSGVDLLAMKSGLAQVQTTLLVNEMHVVHIRGRALRMVGLDDGTASQPDADLLGLADGNTVVAVLCNNLCPLTETNADTNGNGRLLQTKPDAGLLRDFVERRREAAARDERRAQVVAPRRHLLSVLVAARRAADDHGPAILGAGVDHAGHEEHERDDPRESWQRHHASPT